MTRAMILCAGLGTRLGALSDERPKPMLPVCNVPILRYGIANLVGHGVRDIVINLHHRGEVIVDELGDGAALGARVVYTREAQILGTGGGLKRALALLDPDGDDAPFLSLNGKLIFDVDLSALLAAYAAIPSALGMMVVRAVPDAVDWGAVDVRVADVRHPDTGALPSGDSSSSSHSSILRVADILGQGRHMFGGVHVTRPSVVRRLPDGEACMVRQGYLPWLHAGGLVAAFVAKPGYFAEHSTVARYVESNIHVLRGASLRHPPLLERTIDASARVAPSAQLIEPVCVGADAVIEPGAVIGPDVVIGAGAVIASDARLERTVVWPGAHVSGHHRDRVITPHAVVAAEG